MRHHADSNRIKQSWHRSKYNSSFYNSEHVNRYGSTENNQRFYHVKIILKKTCNGLLEIRQITAGAGVDTAGALNDWPAGCAGHRIEGIWRIYRKEVMRLCLAYQVHWWVSKTFTLLLDDWRQSLAWPSYACAHLCCSLIFRLNVPGEGEDIFLRTLGLRSESWLASDLGWKSFL